MRGIGNKSFSRKNSGDSRLVVVLQNVCAPRFNRPRLARVTLVPLKLKLNEKYLASLAGISEMSSRFPIHDTVF